MDPLRDMQMASPAAYCERCRGELYGDAEPDEFGHYFCDECREVLDMEYDRKTAGAVLDAMDGELKKYLSDDLRNEIWNALVQRFPEAEVA